MAQIISIAAVPVLTRIYTPADYGSLALLVSLTAILAAVATGSYYQAVLLPASNDRGELEARALVRLALLIAVSVGTALLVAIAVMTIVNRDWLPPELGFWVFAIPLGVALGGASQALLSYATRLRRYAKIARIAPMQKLVTTGGQIILGLQGAGKAGLLTMTVISPLIGFTLLTQIFRTGPDRAEVAGSDRADRSGPDPIQATAEPPVTIGFVARKYAEFPRVHVWFVLLNTLSWNAQVLLIGAIYTTAELGQYTVAYALLALPASLVLDSVSQVFQRELADRSSDSTAARTLALRTARTLALIAAPALLVLLTIGPQLLTMILGAEWDGAGQIARAMSVLIYCRFVTTSLSSVFVVYRRQGLLLWWQIGALLVGLGSYLIAGLMGASLLQATWLASLLLAPLYLLMGWLALRIIDSGPPPQHREASVTDRVSVA